MGLLDIDIQLDAVVNDEYFENNGWAKYKNFVIAPTNSEGYEPSISWMKLFYIGESKLWIRYDVHSNSMFNLLTGERFVTTDVINFETVVERWVDNSTVFDLK